MIDILATIPGKKRHTHSGWWSFNAICCHHRGHKSDRRGRGGVLIQPDTSWSYSCFNCGFKCGIILGKNFTVNTRLFLGWCGLDIRQIDQLSFDNFAQKTAADFTPEVKPVMIDFEVRKLPEGAQPLDPENPLHSEQAEYIRSRGLSPSGYPYWVNIDGQPRDRHSIIIPYYWNSRIVGYTSRYYDGRKPKYISEQQRGYVFNIDRQRPNWSVCILVEGQFDAISIDGCGYLGSTISDDQAKLLAKLGKRIIVVPDRDKSGVAVCDRALELGYQISIPEWADDIKDTNEAVNRYGRLATTLSIIEAATSSRITVEMRRRKFK